MKTFRDLKVFLSALSEEQLDCDLSVQLSHNEEYYEVIAFDLAEDDDVLDKDHPYIIVET